MDKIDHCRENIFLATTALDEFWDTTKPLVYLGEWCLLYDRRAFWEPLKGKIMISPFRDEGQDTYCYEYINKAYEKTLPLIGKKLNSLHLENHGNRYWRIVLGPWLYYYISAMYDRFQHLKLALELYPDLTTILLSEESFVTPVDTIDFIRLTRTDLYNLQTYTKIFACLGKKFPVTKGRNQSPNFDKKNYREYLTLSLKVAFTNMCVSTFLKFFDPMILRYSYFSKSAESQLMWATSGKVLPLYGPVLSGAPLEDSEVSRDHLKLESFEGDEFINCLYQLLPSDMPIRFVEEFRTIDQEAMKKYPRNTKRIFSANGWYFDEPFKIWSASRMEKGAMLVGAQHGGNYGSLSNMYSEDHETSIVDQYFSWGWERNDCFAKVVPMPATILVGRKKIEASNKKVGILWVTTQHERYLLSFPYWLPHYCLDYLSFQFRFAGALEKEILSEARIRHIAKDYGWSLAKRFSESFPDVRVDSHKIPFHKSLENCRLYVCDHLSTTFIESLAANKPTILFWNSKLYPVKKEAQPFYEMLSRHQILFGSPEEAATTANNIYKDVESWWNDPSRQNAVSQFCERFALASAGSLTSWTEAIIKITG